LKKIFPNKLIAYIFQATGHPYYMDKFPPEVIRVEDRVVVDGRVVTSRGHGTTLEFTVSLVEQLYGKQKAEEVAGPMVTITSFYLSYYFYHVFLVKIAWQSR
jgi:DJ-1/PfpI family